MDTTEIFRQAGHDKTSSLKRRLRVLGLPVLFLAIGGALAGASWALNRDRAPQGKHPIELFLEQSEAREAARAAAKLQVAPTPRVSQAELELWARPCATWRADAEHYRANGPRSTWQSGIEIEERGQRDLEHTIATRCEPRGL